MSETKFCEDCIHFRLSWVDRLLFGKSKAAQWAKCAAVDQSEDKGLRFVSQGPLKKDFATCQIERNPAYDTINKCGSTGKLFQRKGETAPVKSPEPEPPKAAMRDYAVVPFRVPSRKEDLN